MSTLTVTAKGQVTLRKDVLEHLGVHPGEKITVNKLPDGRIEVIAARPTGKIADWSFGERIAVAEKSGLIRGGCARLPEIARRYREITDAAGNPQLTITEKDARRTMQVLHVVMRDLDPGR